MKAQTGKITDKSRKDLIIFTAMTATALALAFTLMAVTADFSQAQEFKGGPQAEGITSQLTEGLNLTAEQQKAIQPIIAEDVQKRQELWEQQKAEREERRAAHRSEIEKIDQDTEARLADILTAEQMQEYNKLLQKHREEMDEKREHRQESKKGRRSANE